MILELALVTATTVSLAVILWCIERRAERGNYRKTKVKMYSDVADAWKILEITEKRMRERSKLSKLN